MLFMAGEFLPADFPRFVRSVTTDELLAMADDILALRRRYMIGQEGCLAAEFRVCCTTMGDSNDHGLGPRRLARKWLSELEAEE